MKPYPQEVIDRARRLYETHRSYRTVSDILGIHRDVICRMAKRGWKIGTPGLARRLMPDDFRIMANRMTIIQLCQHYKAAQTTVYRWLSNCDRDYKAKSSARRSISPPNNFPEIVARFGPTKAADILGVNAGTLLKWRKAHNLPVLKKRKRPICYTGWPEQYFSNVKIDRANRRVETAVMAEPVFDPIAELHA